MLEESVLPRWTAIGSGCLTPVLPALVGRRANILEGGDATLLEVQATLFTLRILECFDLLVIAHAAFHAGTVPLTVKPILELVSDLIFVKYGLICPSC